MRKGPIFATLSFARDVGKGKRLTASRVTLAGRGERLKGYSIALEVFGRPETFDPVADPIVRIEAGRLREKLRCYYDTYGCKDHVRITLPRGTYRPAWRRAPS